LQGKGGLSPWLKGRDGFFNRQNLFIIHSTAQPCSVYESKKARDKVKDAFIPFLDQKIQVIYK
jgi:hypothetical protein